MKRKVFLDKEKEHEWEAKAYISRIVDIEREDQVTVFSELRIGVGKDGSISVEEVSSFSDLPIVEIRPGHLPSLMKVIREVRKR